MGRAAAPPGPKESMKQLTVFVALLGIVVAGCGGEAHVTQAQEKAFRNAPKTMPPQAAEGMKKGMEEQKKRQAQGSAPISH